MPLTLPRHWNHVDNTGLASAQSHTPKITASPIRHRPIGPLFPAAAAHIPSDPPGNCPGPTAKKSCRSHRLAEQAITYPQVGGVHAPGELFYFQRGLAILREQFRLSAAGVENTTGGPGALRHPTPLGRWRFRAQDVRQRYHFIEGCPCWDRTPSASMRAWASYRKPTLAPVWVPCLAYRSPFPLPTSVPAITAPQAEQWPGSTELLDRAESAPVACPQTRESDRRESTPDGQQHASLRNSRIIRSPSLLILSPFYFCFVTGLPVLCPANTFFSGLHFGPVAPVAPSLHPKLLPAPTARTLAPTPKVSRKSLCSRRLPRGSWFDRCPDRLDSRSSARYRLPVPASRIPYLLYRIFHVQASSSNIAWTHKSTQGKTAKAATRNRRGTGRSFSTLAAYRHRLRHKQPTPPATHPNPAISKPRNTLDLHQGLLGFEASRSFAGVQTRPPLDILHYVCTCLKLALELDPRRHCEARTYDRRIVTAANSCA
ncbi:hypothetical protein QBC40DRAFT_298470 [Triangularia verruculosa]|uniref:Uncharacterized protein n=1 Tax=Triangularia verruculosa TaxID=2587418 RepID=A0AAN7AT67_9PEZI|nr:hypothetical protein QBC40DRAFT_298470 [Triangularia verruculosa]